MCSRWPALVLAALFALFACCSPAPDDTADDAATTRDALDDHGDGSEATLPDEMWSILHGNGARTVAVRACGVATAPRERFHSLPQSPSVFSGPVLGPVDPDEYGSDYLIYRTLGPGPMSLAPPEWLDRVVGSLARVEVIHPDTGELIRSVDFNVGLFQNFAQTDTDGNVLVQDLGRVQKWAPGLREHLWATDFTPLVGRGLLEATPAGSLGFAPDGVVVVAFLDGTVCLLDPADGAILSTLRLGELAPPVAGDPQLGEETRLRNAVAYDGDLSFYLVSREIVVLRYHASPSRLEVVDRFDYGGFSSSTPTLDTERRRGYFVVFDPENAESGPEMVAFDYGTLPVVELWRIPVSVDHPDSEDQLTATYVPPDILLNNSLYGPVTAYRVYADGRRATPLWSAADTVGADARMYIASASVNDRTVYVFDNTRRTLFGLDADTGVVRWQWPIEAQSIKTPIPYRGRVLLDHNAGLLCLEGDGPAF